jgi:hypothetical protein
MGPVKAIMGEMFGKQYAVLSMRGQILKSMSKSAHVRL